jgi:hypothetical protein
VNEDFQDVLAALLASGARFLVVGAHALAVHGVPRATGDLDIWVLPDLVNAERVWEGLIRFGAPMETLGAASGDLARPGLVLQIGLPPRRIDILTALTGVDFESAGARAWCTGSAPWTSPSSTGTRSSGTSARPVGSGTWQISRGWGRGIEEAAPGVPSRAGIAVVDATRGPIR